MKISHLISKLGTLNPELPVLLSVRGFVEVPIGPGDGGEIMYRAPCEETKLCASLRLHADDIAVIGGRAVVSVNYTISYELTDKLRFGGALTTGNQRAMADPESDEDRNCKTLVFPASAKTATSDER